MAIWTWILIAVVVVVVVAIGALAARRHRTTALRQRFGPEYDRAVEAREDRQAAEADLRERERRRAELDIKPLPEAMRVRCAEEWQDLQERFVDQPSDAVVGADQLIYTVMAARGYPMGDFDAQADLLSVDHPHVVENYRQAHGIHQQARQASTETLREALLRYRSLFDELLEAGDRDELLAAAEENELLEAAEQEELLEADSEKAGITADRGPITRPDQRRRSANHREAPDERL